MNDPKLNELLNWSIRNSADAPPETSDPTRGLSADALNSILGGPSDADRMRGAMSAILSDEVDLENKMIAFDNLEQLVEQIDNANNMQNLGLWMPLNDLLDSSEKDLRLMAAWCIGTAVQNNPQCQERCLAVGALPKLVKIATQDQDAAARKKAIRALSSESRNYQFGWDEVVKHLPDGFKPEGETDAGDMDGIDAVMNKLREAAAAKAS